MCKGPSTRVLSACGCERCATRLPNFPKTAAGIASGALPTAPMADRFLRGCKGDAKKAAHVLTDSLCWREEYGADALRDESEPDGAPRAAVVQSFYPTALHTRRDRKGRVVWIERVGLCDPSIASAKRVYQNAAGQWEDGPTAWLRCHVRLNELAGRQHAERVVIMDMQEMNSGHVSSAGIALIKSMIALDQRHYPETLHALLIVNAPWILEKAFAIIRQGMDPVTLGKIKVLGSTTNASVHSELLAHIDVADLPDFLGGELAGCCPIHPRLRAGSAPVDGEATTTIDAGATRHASAAVPVPVEGSELWIRSSAACAVTVDVIIDGGAAVTGASVGPAPQCFPLAAAEGAGEVELRVTSTNRMRSGAIFWTLGGVSADAWAVE